MKRPTNKDEFLDQAIFETNDLLASAEEEGDDGDFSAYLPVHEQIYRELRELHDAVREDRHVFGGGADLRCMPRVRKWKSRIPFADIIKMLNGAHQRGF